MFGCNSREFADRTEYLDHVRLLHEEQRCELCKQVFAGSRSMQVHLRLHLAAGDEDGDDDSPPTSSSVPAEEGPAAAGAAADGGVVFRCALCPGAFRERTILLDHVDIFHVECVCLECGSLLLGSEQCADHIADQHPPNKVLEGDQDRCHYQCSACLFVFSRRSEVERHFVENHFVADSEDKVFHCCPLCKDVFRSYVRLHDHLRWEHLCDQAVAGSFGRDEIDDDNFYDDDDDECCGNVAAGKGTHLRSRSAEEATLFQCEICDHFFEDEAVLRRHFEGHHLVNSSSNHTRLARFGPAYFAADVKDLVAKQEPQLRRHRRRHRRRRHRRHSGDKSCRGRRRRRRKGLKSKGDSKAKRPRRREDDEVSGTHDPQNLLRPRDQTVPNGVIAAARGPAESASTRSSPAPHPNPEVEQAVASISSETFDVDKVMETLVDNLDVDNSIVTLNAAVSGPLEVEKAVSSILDDCVMTASSEATASGEEEDDEVEDEVDDEDEVEDASRRILDDDHREVLLGQDAAPEAPPADGVYHFEADQQMACKINQFSKSLAEPAEQHRPTTTL